MALGSITLVLATFAVWRDRQLLQTDDWVETSTELLEDPDIEELAREKRRILGEG